MERSAFKAMFAVLLVMLTVLVVRALRKPEARRRLMDTLPIHVAFLVLLLDRVITLSPAFGRVTHVAVVALLVLAFGRLLWGAKPWK
jgi:hypothetical protein